MARKKTPPEYGLSLYHTKEVNYILEMDVLWIEESRGEVTGPMMVACQWN